MPFGNHLPFITSEGNIWRFEYDGNQLNVVVVEEKQERYS